jgi:N-acetylneuraminic acid mutarotase
LIPDAPEDVETSRAKGPILKWRLENDMPSSRYALAAATAPNGSIFVIGGSSDTSILNTVDEYSPHKKRWESGPPLPSPRYRLAAATGGDGRIYAIGGSDPFPGGEGAFLNSVLFLTPGSKQWVPITPMPTARQLLGAATGIDGRIYVVGGSNVVNGISNVLNVLEIYDPATGPWVQGAPMPTPRYSVAVAAADDGCIYAIGGSGAAFSTLSTW